MLSATKTLEFLDLLRGDGLSPLFQPIVRLDDLVTVGFESLARGPKNSLWERPDQLFGAAESFGVSLELDHACCAASLRTGLSSGFRSPHTLFVNLEPATLAEPLTTELEQLLEQALESFRVVIEVTERAITTQPAELLKSLGRVRDLGCGVALDDVGADVRSLALMPFVEPDVIKLDLSLVQQQPSAAVGAIASAVAAEVERNGAQVVAEGIETAEHLDIAVAIGATLGQGWLLGRPAPLGNTEPPKTQTIEVRPARNEQGATPFQILSNRRPIRSGTKRILLTMSQQLEEQALTFGEAPVVFAALQERAFFTLSTRNRYERLAQRGSLIAALGIGMDLHPAAGVRGGPLDVDDPIRGEWVVAVVGPHFAGAFAAVDEGDRVADMNRRFMFALTHERELVLEIARSMIGRIQA